MSPQMTVIFGQSLGQAALDEARRKAEETHKKAAQAAKNIEKEAVEPCPLDVKKLCKQKEQDEFEKRYDIDAGCGYYRRRHNDFLERNPGMTPPRYYLEYGEKYCKRFTGWTYDKLSPEGKEWFKKVKCGLQQGIEDILQDPKRRYLEYLGKDFSDEAFKMHAPVYLKNGLTNIDLFWDQLAVGVTPIEEFIPILGDNLEAAWGQVGEVLPEIAKAKRDWIVDGIKRDIESAEDMLLNYFNLSEGSKQ